MQYSLNQFGRQEYEFKREILDRIRALFYEEKDIIKLALGMSRFVKFEQMLNSDPFDDSAIPQSLINKLTAKDDYLLLMFYLLFWLLIFKVSYLRLKPFSHCLPVWH